MGRGWFSHLPTCSPVHLFEPPLSRIRALQTITVSSTSGYQSLWYSKAQAAAFAAFAEADVAIFGAEVADPVAGHGDLAGEEPVAQTRAICCRCWRR